MRIFLFRENSITVCRRRLGSAHGVARDHWLTPGGGVHLWRPLDVTFYCLQTTTGQCAWCSTWSLTDPWGGVHLWRPLDVTFYCLQTTTGQCAWCSTWSLTDPWNARLIDPFPRVPITMLWTLRSFANASIPSPGFSPDLITASTCPTWNQGIKD